MRHRHGSAAEDRDWFEQRRTAALLECGGSRKRSPVKCDSDCGVVSVTDPADQLSHSLHSAPSRRRRAFWIPEETAGLTDDAAHTLPMLQHAQHVLHLPSLDLLAGLIPNPKPPSWAVRTSTCPGCPLSSCTQEGAAVQTSPPKKRNIICILEPRDNEAQYRLRARAVKSNLRERRTRYVRFSRGGGGPCNARTPTRKMTWSGR